MTFYRTVKKNNPFVQIDKGIVNDPDISAKAKGIMLYLLSKPEGWKIYEVDIVNNMKDGKSSISAGIKELIEAGYIKRERLRCEETGLFKGYSYTVFEVKQENKKVEKPQDNNVSTETRFSDNGKPDNGKHDTINIDFINNEFSNINNSVTTKVDNVAVNKKESDQPNRVNHSNTIKDIITYLNDKTGKRYSHNASGNKRIIQARLNEGYTFDDFKRVIDHKCNEWLPPVKFSNGKMSDTYLRPATLFNQKFDQYLNESPDVEVKPKTDKPSTFQGYF